MAFPKKISELPISQSLSNADLLAIVSGGITSQTTLGEISASISGHTIPSFTGNTSGTCIDEIWVTTISGCSPVVIGPELIVNGDLEVTGPLNFPNLISCEDDTDAGLSGLTAGDLYQTNGNGAAPLTSAGIVMIKQ